MRARAVRCALLAAILYALAVYLDGPGVDAYRSAVRAAAPGDAPLLDTLEWLIPFMSRVAHGLAPALFAAGVILEALVGRDAQRSAETTSRSNSSMPERS